MKKSRFTLSLTASSRRKRGESATGANISNC